MSVKPWFLMIPLICCLVLKAPTPCARADIYGFEDKDGVLHLSNVPVDTRYRLIQKETTKRVRESLYESRRKRYDAMIGQVARKSGLDPDLIRAVVDVESRFDPEAVSVKGAMGLMQLMPETAQGLGVKDPFNPLQNLEGGAEYLRMLLEKYAGQLTLALAAYNAGEKAVDLYQEIPPYPETQDYVRKVMRLYEKATSGRQH